MADLLRLFFNIDDPNHESFEFSDETRRRLCFDCHTVVLMGPSLGKTSMCWAYCQSVAAEGFKSYILCSRSRLDRKGLPFFLSSSHGGPNSPLWTHVEILYADSLPEALAALRIVGRTVDAPRAVCVDDLAFFCPSSSSSSSSQSVRDGSLFLAALSETMRCLRKHSPQCVTWVCWTTSTMAFTGVGQDVKKKESPLEALLHKWSPLVLNLKKSGGPTIILSREEEPLLRYALTSEGTMKLLGTSPKNDL